MIAAVDFGCWRLSHRLPAAAGRCLQKAFQLLEGIARSPYHDVVPEILALVCRLQQRRYSEIGTKIVEHLANLSAAKGQCQRKATSEVFTVLKDPDFVINGDLIDLFRRYLRALYVSRLGEAHVGVVELDLEVYRALGKDVEAAELASSTERSVADIDRKFGPFSRRAIMNLVANCHRLAGAGQIVEEERMGKRLVSRVEKVELEYPQNYQNFIASSYGDLGAVQASLGRLEEAAYDLSRSMEASEKLRRQDALGAIQRIQLLRRVSIQLGEANSATLLERRISGIIQTTFGDDEEILLRILSEVSGGSERHNNTETI